ncbi:MAG: hypothetical protein ACI814_001746 [Mariniblastus sp.]|jgi:hypothetical protein
MNRFLYLFLLLILTSSVVNTVSAHCLRIANEDLTKPIVANDTVFQESCGLVAVEAEHFFKQTLTNKRAFYLTTRDKTPQVEKDGDPNHVGAASNGSYLEILPDSRRNHGHKLISGENFSDEPGKLAVVHYKINFSSPGRYYVWARAHSTGSEDNGLHVGLDGQWPESGQRMQWCVAKNTWRWDSMQRTEKAHCGVPHQIFLDVPTTGVHEVHFSLREDGFEFDKFLLTKDMKFPRPHDAGPKFSSNSQPPTFEFVDAPNQVSSAPPQPTPASSPQQMKSQQKPGSNSGLTILAKSLKLKSTDYYIDANKWLAINPEKHKTASIQTKFPFPSGTYNVVLRAVGENDGQSTYSIKIDSEALKPFEVAMSQQRFETGQKFHGKWSAVKINKNQSITIASTIASADGVEYSRARWEAIVFRPADDATRKATKATQMELAKKQNGVGKNTNSESSGQQATDDRDRSTSPTVALSKTPLVQPRLPDGDGSLVITGEPKVWHKVTLTLNGPYAHEQDNDPNPFLDYAMQVQFRHGDGTTYNVPGFFAADGHAKNTSAESGTQWRTHFAPDRPGIWEFKAVVYRGSNITIDLGAPRVAMASRSGSLNILPSDKSGVDLRGKGRLQYVNQRYLQHMGDRSYFLKAGADAPETLLGYEDFDGTVAGKAKSVPLKSFAKHVQDWSEGDPSWKNGKGKGLIGAVNYLSGKGCDAFSFLTYNAGGDGDNVWPFIQRDDKLHYDCSKLDQWGVVFDHGTAQGMYLHFKMQETENDDHRKGHGESNYVPTSLDGGNLGPQRKLYIRELVARFGHNLALNWNLGEENTQSLPQQKDMIEYIKATDPYQHLIVVHTYPDQQDKIYNGLIGSQSSLTGTSLQNSHIRDTHWQTVKWVNASKQAGRPWVVAFDESGSAAHGQVPDLGYQGFDGKDGDGKDIYNQHSVRHSTLWGTLMGGGAGVEYYFGYKLAENDLKCEDWRSRDQSWDYCRIALDFFRTNVPFNEMVPADQLIGNSKNDDSKYCLANPNETYVIYLPKGGATTLDLSETDGTYSITWFNPRSGGNLFSNSVTTLKGGQLVEVDSEKSDGQDWVALIRIQ